MKSVVSNTWFVGVIMAIALIAIAWLAASVVIPPLRNDLLFLFTDG